MGSGLCSMVKKLPCRSCGNRSIKVMTALDGKIVRFKRPVYVKEILEEYPHHGIFDAGSVERLGTNVLTCPLDHNSELQPRLQPYYLIPLLSAGSGLEESKQIHSHPQLISASSIDGGRLLRVKLRMRKKDLASFVKSANIKFGENFVTEEPLNLDMAQHGYESGSGFAPGWKPTLNAISELNSH